MQFPTNILDGPTATDILAYFKQNPVYSLSGFNLWTFDAVDDEAAAILAECNIDPLWLDSLHFLSPEHD